MCGAAAAAEMANMSQQQMMKEKKAPLGSLISGNTGAQNISQSEIIEAATNAVHRQKGTLLVDA